MPLARYVAQHEHQLNFPFRRYQIQRVYRGERNQKGRYREFYQCDIDVIGKDTLPLAYDAEAPAVIDGIFSRARVRGVHDQDQQPQAAARPARGARHRRASATPTVLHEVDRLGKQARAEIEARLAGEDVGLAAAVATRLLDLLTGTAGDSRATLEALRAVEAPTPAFVDGLAELQAVYDGTLALGVPASRLRDRPLDRRAASTTTPGTVYETFLDDHPRLGSICSGGRYENLAGHYTKSKLPGVGISIGATRLFSQLLEMNVIDAASTSVAHVLVLAVEPGLAAEYARLATELRAAGLNVEVYGGDDKLGKQLKYADRARVPLALLLGSREQEAGVVKVKDLREGAAVKEQDVARDELVAIVRGLLPAVGPR